MSQFQRKYGPWAIVTGASAGLGEEFARQLAAKDLNLVLVARRRERLNELGAALQSEYGVDTRAVALDLTDEDFLAPLLAEIGDLEIGLLVNNAGLGIIGEFLDTELDTELGALALNCRAPLILAHHFGRAMRERGRGGIIMLSSIAGLIPQPYFAHYGATKAWDLFLGEGLAVELAPHGIDVLSLCPGPTRTEFLETADLDLSRLPAGAERFLMTAPDVVAAAVNGLGKRSRVVPGMQNKLMVGSARFTPSSWVARITGQVMRRAGGK